MEQPRTITLDNITYDIEQFTDTVKQLVGIYNKFNVQLQDHQLEVMKTQAAIQQLSTQITEQVRKELEEKKSKEE